MTVIRIHCTRNRRDILIPVSQIKSVWPTKENDGCLIYDMDCESFYAVDLTLDQIAVMLNGEQPRPDWRIGVAVKPKMRDHIRHGEWAVVREVRPDGQLVLERNDNDGRFTASAKDWMTA